MISPKFHFCTISLPLSLSLSLSLSLPLTTSTSRDKKISCYYSLETSPVNRQSSQAGMDLGSPNSRLEEINDAQKEEGSFSVGKLDLNLAVSREEGSDAYGRETVTVDLNRQSKHGSPFFPAGVRCEESDSFSMKSSLSGRTEFEHDEVGEKSFIHDPEGLKSPLKDTHYQGGTGSLSYSPSGKSSYPHDSEMSPDERNEEAYRVWESSRIADTSYQEEEEEEEEEEEGEEGEEEEEEEDMQKVNFDPGRGYSALHDGKVKDYSGNASGDSQNEKTESTYEEVEKGASDYHGKKLLSPEKMQDNGDKSTREVFYHSSNSPSENGKMERLRSDLDSPQITPKRPASSGRQMSVSPERSPYIEQSPQERLSSPRGDQDPSYYPRSSRERHSPRSSRKRYSPSLQKFGVESKRVPSQRTSISPKRRSHQDSQHRGDASPRRNYSPSSHRKQERSMLRSPIRRRDSSSGSKGDHRGRSRSRSPYARAHYRRSPRRRYSPSHRSPPSRYSRKRPWSPPHNRNTGIGRPGNNLFVAGFSFVTTERDLERKFSRFGRVRNVRIVRDKRSGDSRGFGFLSLERDEDADAAIRALDKSEWNGRIVLVEKSNTPTS
ncbi:scaffold attachment factor B1-like [Macadamia integrifolia]|uniref:scaffold attachment factor B1-like n=1 Tax=Macadamia integrifolia TaxID=60698 RepID=UPI001C4EFC80|nr:scaffold attachment factor B1-like [Macadamia integrifolia]